MNTEQIINIASLALAVGAVVYGYVKHKTATQVAAAVSQASDQALQLQATIVNVLHAMKEPLEAAVKQLPKTRSKRVSVDVDTDPNPPSAA